MTGASCAVSSYMVATWFFGNDHEMHVGLRLDVVEGEHVVVLVDLPARDVAAHDLAEDAVRIGFHARKAAS